MKTVAVEYAYPSSPHSETYGYYHTGCYVVSIDDELGTHYISAHPSQNEAVYEAEKTGLPFHKYSLGREEKK